MQIRDAEAGDMAQIAAIYNEIVATSTATFNDRPATPEDRTAWWQARHVRGFPVLVAAEGGTVGGFASYGEFRSWPGYRFTVEATIYIAEPHRNRGLGRRLLTALVSRARAQDLHVMVACVDAGNTASLSFLAGFGFESAGRLRQVGYKFGRYLDLILLQYFLTSPIESEAP